VWALPLVEALTDTSCLTTQDKNLSPATDLKFPDPLWDQDLVDGLG